VARVPIVRFGDVLVATVQQDLYDRDALTLQDELASTLQRTGVGGVLLDISVVETVDSFLARVLSDIADVARLMGARTVVVGIQPAVAITLVELGLELRGIRTALNAEKGLALLGRRAAREDRRERLPIR
jgi:rsbT antagonist protein RsbS